VVSSVKFLSVFFVDSRRVALNGGLSSLTLGVVVPLFVDSFSAFGVVWAVDKKRAAGCGLRDAGCGLRTAGCGLRAADCRIGRTKKLKRNNK